MMVCRNCGAEIDDKATSCPYCNAMQYDASEAEYMNNLYKMNSQMDNLDDEAKKEALLWTMKLVMTDDHVVIYDGLLRLLLHHSELVIPQTEECCRLILKKYMETSKSTRLVLLLLLVKLHSVDPENVTVEKMLQYTQDLNSRDVDVDVRVQARNIHAVRIGGVYQYS